MEGAYFLCGLFEQKDTHACVLGRRLPHPAAPHGKLMLKPQLLQHALL